MRALKQLAMCALAAVILLSPISVWSGTAQNSIGSEAPENPASIAKRRSLESILGREVKTRTEGDAGRIVDLLADREGRVQAAVIEFGGFLGIGTRKIAVAWNALTFEGGVRQPTVIVDLTHDQLRVAPEYKPNEPAVIRRAED